MRKFAIATMMIALLAVPAYGQRTSRTDAEKKADADAEAAYQKTMKATKDKSQAAPADPWGTVRPKTGSSEKTGSNEKR
jgi:hypothetical protein